MTVHAITTYFNPCHYRTRRINYDLFIQALREQGVLCLTVENAFGDDPFELPPGPGIIQVRSASVMWQKERLLNLAASWLPHDCTYVAWLDCDILFDNPLWAKQLENVLQEFPIAQVWTTADRLNEEGQSIADCVTSFAATMRDHPQSLEANRYDVHGHTGYGWAMRRTLFDQVGLYEAAVSGSADHFMAHAIYGNCGFCIQNALKNNQPQIEHFQEWAHDFYRLTQGKLGVVEGNIRHLWHGSLASRRYFLRMHDITNLGFNPWTDIQSSPGQPLGWTDLVHQTKPLLTQYFSAYFKSRNEDGVTL